MMRAILLIAALSLGPTIASAETIKIGQTTRHYAVQLPELKLAPLVIVLHGNTQNGADMVTRTGVARLRASASTRRVHAAMSGKSPLASQPKPAFRSHRTCQSAAGRGDSAGPEMTSPAGVKREPWHGQSHVRSALFQPTVHPMCGQMAERTVTVPAASR